MPESSRAVSAASVVASARCRAALAVSLRSARVSLAVRAPSLACWARASA
ncbi:hypothetical protein ACFFX0_17960 [Citricoccus parietis]|uniref:Uncharacterized protein n=1 Tax=Citricoccus parietis TaxID=592307 RepID=A0ABV5G218_9MICC